MTAAPDYVRIQDKAQKVVENMRKATAARNESQTRAADFIAEQMERLANAEAELVVAQQEREALEGRLRQSEETAAAAAARHEREAAEAAESHRKEAEGLVTQAAAEIARLREWVSNYQTDMSGKQAELERSNARLTLESERLTEENGILAQSAETLLAAIEEGAAAMQRQDALVEEALRRSPPRTRPEGSVVRLLPSRPRAEPGVALAVAQAG